ncbi:MAG: hypothetical protein ACT4PX_01870 [Actinomycetota bacterium]
MRMWRRAALLSLLVWVLAVGSWANRSWTESVPLVTPPDVEAESRSFVCGAPLGSRTVHPRPPIERPYPLSREPCRLHDERRALAVVDLLIGVAGVVALVYFGARHAARKEPDPALPVA